MLEVKEKNPSWSEGQGQGRSNSRQEPSKTEIEQKGIPDELSIWTNTQVWMCIQEDLTAASVPKEA